MTCSITRTKFKKPKVVFKQMHAGKIISANDMCNGLAVCYLSCERPGLATEIFWSVYIFFMLYNIEILGLWTCKKKLNPYQSQNFTLLNKFWCLTVVSQYYHRSMQMWSHLNTVPRYLITGITSCCWSNLLSLEALSNQTLLLVKRFWPLHFIWLKLLIF